MGLSLAVATGLYGISFGALAVAAGLSVAQTAALSALMFTGGSQFAFIGVVGAGGSLPSAFGAATLLGVRNAVYGMQIASMFRPGPGLIPVQAQLTIDESTAAAIAQDLPAEQRRGFWTAGIGVYVLWNLFTLAGALGGNALGDPTAWGLDGAAVAAFVGLLWPRLRHRDAWAVAVVAAVAALLAVPATPAGVPIMIAAATAGVMAITRRGAAPR